MSEKKYFYKTTIEICVLCGHERKIRERVYTDIKPLSEKLLVVVDTACSNHFL